MQSEPSYVPQKRRSPYRTLWIVAGVLLATCCAGLIAVGFFGFRIMKESMPFVGCLAYVQSIGEAVREYEKKNGRLPAAERWQDDLKQFFRPDPQEIPFAPGYSLDEPAGCKDASGKTTTSFAFNANLAGKRLKDIPEPAKEPILFEAPAGGRNSSRPYSQTELSASPAIVLGKKRGWIELDLDGEIYLSGMVNGKSVRRRAQRTGQTRFIFQGSNDVPNEPGPR